LHRIFANVNVRNKDSVKNLLHDKVAFVFHLKVLGGVGQGMQESLDSELGGGESLAVRGTGLIFVDAGGQRNDYCILEFIAQIGRFQLLTNEAKGLQTGQLDLSHVTVRIGAKVVNQLSPFAAGNFDGSNGCDKTSALGANKLRGAGKSCQNGFLHVLFEEGLELNPEVGVAGVHGAVGNQVFADDGRHLSGRLRVAVVGDLLD
jgi:hypothetical protein